MNYSDDKYAEGYSDCEQDIAEMGIDFAKGISKFFDKMPPTTPYSIGYATALGVHKERTAR